MAHTLIATLLATHDGQVRVVCTGYEDTLFATLRQAEDYAFSLGADACSSYGRGVIRATRYEAPAPVVAPVMRSVYAGGAGCTPGAALLAHGGKLHRAVQYGNGSVQPVCGCPGTSNNHRRAIAFYPGMAATRRRS